MAKRGPKPSPAKVKIFRETRKDRIRQGEIKPPDGLPSCPDYLDDDGRAAWKMMVDLLSPTGALTPLDGPALGNYSRLFSVALQAERKIRSTGGVLSETQLGGDKANPAVQILISATAQMNKLLIEFGMTPASRSSLKAPGDGPKDELGDFLSKKA